MMDIEIIMLSEVKSEGERQIPYDINYMWNLKFPGGPVSKTPRIQCREPGFDPWSGN